MKTLQETKQEIENTVNHLHELFVSIMRHNPSEHAALSDEDYEAMLLGAAMLVSAGQIAERASMTLTLLKMHNEERFTRITNALKSNTSPLSPQISMSA